MKKLRILMALALSLGVFTACGNKPAEPATTEPAPAAPAAPAATETTETTETTEENVVADGTYESTAMAPGGELKVNVELKDGKIVAVNVLDHKEDTTDEAVNEALTSIPEQIVEKNSTGDITPVAGAEEISNAIVEAVDSALEMSVTK